MLKMRLLPLVLALLSFPGFAGAQLVDFYGYTWDPGTTGNELRLVGNVDQIFAPLVSDPLNEYTISVRGLVPGAPEDQGGGWVHTIYTAGVFEIWEDSSPDLAYGVDPPNAVSPSTFENGTLYLSGYFTAFEVFRNAGVGIGSFQGNVEFSGGSHMIDLITGGWTFGGTTVNAPGMPSGYIETWDGMLYMNSTSTGKSSWGEVKNLFR